MKTDWVDPLIGLNSVQRQQQQTVGGLLRRLQYLYLIRPDQVLVASCVHITEIYTKTVRGGERAIQIEGAAQESSHLTYSVRTIAKLQNTSAPK